MSRQVVAGILGLALAGCATDRFAASRATSNPSTVALTPPLSTIHETINQENPLVDTDSVRAGHPVAANDSPRSARVVRAEINEPPAPSDNAEAKVVTKTEADTAPSDNAEAKVVTKTEADQAPADKTDAKVVTKTETDTAPPDRPATAPAPEPVPSVDTAFSSVTVPSERPAPFARLRGRLRARAGSVPKVVDPDLAPPVEAGAGAAVASTAPKQPTPEPAATTPEGAMPAAVEPAPVDLASAPTQPPAADPDGRAKVPTSATPDPGIEPTASSGPDKPDRPPARDPLLGADPDIMPSFDTAPAPKSEPAPSRGPEPGRPPADAPALDKQPAPEQPTDVTPAPVALPTAAPPEVKPTPAPEAPSVEPNREPEKDAPAESAPAPVIHLSPPTDIEPAATTAPASSPASSPAPAGPTAPAPGGDPLLGASPDLMPKFDLPPAREAKPSAPRHVTIPGNDGRPPSMSEIMRAESPQPTPPADDSTRPDALPSVPGPSPSPLPASPATLPSAAEPPSAAPAPSPAPVSVSAPTPEPAPEPAPRAESAAPSRDPLLGANPDVMPKVELPPDPAVEPASAATPAPKPDPVPAEPKPKPAPEPAKPTKSQPAKPSPKPQPAKPAPKPAPATAPAPAGDVSAPVDLPPLSGAGASTGAAEPTPSRGFASLPVTAAPEKADEPTAVRSNIAPRAVFAAGKPYAWVGDDVITMHELTVAYKHRLKDAPPGQEIPPETKKMLIRQVLNDMIDRSLVIQEARRELKDAKKFQKFMEMADKVFFDEEVPPLLRQTGSADVVELKKKLIERGETLDELREQFRLEFLSRGYMEQKLTPKMKVDLIEMREYYRNHLDDFNQPAQITWREVLVEVDRSKSRAEARAKADAILARLRRGDDFASVARTATDGPNKSDGGLWKTSPGSYGVPAVNAALATLPLGQVSPVIEGPTSYHVVVVEGRRDAGPATFAEVQDQLYKAIRRQKVNRETTAYIEKLRSRSLVRTVFDPAVTRASAEVVSPAPNAPRP